ncbi:MAG: HAMP domain-containing histidine kinase [Oscillospiraceae bacterium]|jgi:signal transduction histidine kinase|nr:HAMP domain-containing histidine kinase [Oscillospiraceae bacterium]
MRQARLKIGAAIIAFTLFLTLAFISGAYLLFAAYNNGLEKAMEDVGGVYVLSPENAYDFTVSGSTSGFISGHMLGRDDLQSFFGGQIQKSLPIIVISFCALLAVSALILWRVLSKIEQTRTKRLVRNLHGISEDAEILETDPVLSDAYNHLKALFAQHFEDYRRLQSYLVHEQKNNIAILKACLDLQNNEPQARILGAISDGIDDIVTIGDSAGDAARSEVDAALVCARACDAYKNLAQLHFDFDETHNYDILAKERWIYRAVCNLLDNAVKYGNGKPIEVAVRRQKSSVVLTVTDHGIGIPKSEQEKIWDHRYRVQTLKKDGYGIGLSLVSHVADLCGGFVYVDSESGKGASFYLSFPALHA